MSGADDNEHQYDLAIVGSGGAAFAGAIAARRRELPVAMIERETIGGTCVNVGCIPSKALLAAAEARHRAGVSRFPGISTQPGAVDFTELIAGKREIVEGMRQRKYLDLADEYGIELIRRPRALRRRARPGRRWPAPAGRALSRRHGLRALRR